MTLHDPTAHDLHQEISALLPWYANNTLNANDKMQVEKHLECCALCSRNLAALQMLAKSVASAPVPASSTEQVYGKLLASIAQQSNVKPPQRIRSPKAKTPQPRFSWKNIFPDYRPLALAALLILAVAPMAALLFRQLAAPNFHTLSNRMPVTAIEPADLRLVFKAEMDLPKIDNLLASIDAHRVGQPGVGGVYFISLPKQPTGQAQRRETAMAYLRQQEGVLFVEPVLGP